jgi:hypothetical protein
MLGIVFALIIYEIVQTLVMIIKFKETISINYQTALILPLLTALIILFVLLNIEIHFAIKIIIAVCLGIPLVAIAGRLNTEDIKYVKRLMI